MKIKHKPCLVLNLDYSPVSIIDWRVAINWYFKTFQQKNPAIDIVQYYQNDKIVGCAKLYSIPSIIKLNSYIKAYKNSVKFTRKNLFQRR